jgi:hypothetical protein
VPITTIIVFIRYKRIGKNLYAYQVRTYWDPKARKVRQDARYLGKVIDKEKQKFEKVLYRKHEERTILDFGDVYLLSHMYRNSGLEKIVHSSFPRQSFFVKTFVFNRIIQPLPLKSLYYWVSTNALKEEGEISQLTSQNITEMLADIGSEENVKEFLQRYLEEYASATPTVLMDLTAMPTLISSMLSDWGYADSNIEHKIGLLLVSERDTRLPLFFKLVPGNRTSVTLLDETLDELRGYKISQPFLVLDKGFFSAENLEKMKDRKMGFIIGLPATSMLFDVLVEKIVPTIQTPSNAFMLNGVHHFGIVEKVKVEGIPLYAYVILNPERRTREEKELYSEILERIAYLAGRKRKRKVKGEFVEFKYGKARMKEEEIERELRRKGVMILLSTKRMDCAGALELYYSRDVIEKNFRYFKSDLNLLPARVHREDGIRAYLLLMFISLYLLLQLKKVKLPMSLAEGFLLLRMVKKKIYDETSVVVGVGKEQKEIFEKFGCIVPK